MKTKTFGFVIGKSEVPIDVKETTEKKATLKFIDKFWKRISEEKGCCVITLLGELENNN
jgi:hypothetical protein